MGISKSRMSDYYRRYKSEPHRTLDDVYINCSRNKRIAWKIISDRMLSQGGKGLSVISRNGSFTFTTGYVYTDKQKRKHFVVDTRDNMEDVLVSDL